MGADVGGARHRWQVAVTQLGARHCSSANSSPSRLQCEAVATLFVCVARLQPAASQLPGVAELPRRDLVRYAGRSGRGRLRVPAGLRDTPSRPLARSASCGAGATARGSQLARATCSLLTRRTTRRRAWWPEGVGRRSNSSGGGPARRAAAAPAGHVPCCGPRARHTPPSTCPAACSRSSCSYWCAAATSPCACAADPPSLPFPPRRAADVARCGPSP